MGVQALVDGALLPEGTEQVAGERAAMTGTSEGHDTPFSSDEEVKGAMVFFQEAGE